MADAAKHGDEGAKRRKANGMIGPDDEEGGIVGGPAFSSAAATGSNGETASASCD